MIGSVFATIRKALLRHPRLLKVAVFLYAKRFGGRVVVRLGQDGKSLSISNRPKQIKISIQNYAFLGDIIENFDYYANAIDPVFEGGAQVSDLTHIDLHVTRSMNASYRSSLQIRVDKAGRYLALRDGIREIRISSAHPSYLADVAREFDYYFDSVVAVPVGGLSVADFSEPKLHDIPGLGQAFLFTSLPEGSSTNDAYLKAFGIAPGDVVIDAGAYCGLTAFLFSRAVSDAGKVVAVEADPQNFAALSSNLERLEASNVVPLHAALWSEAGTVEFASESNMGSAVSAVGPRHEGLVSVPALTLNDVCEMAGLQRVDHVKMDIEGAEYQVLLSAGDFIHRFRPDFIIEAHNEGEGAINVDKLRNFFAGFDYGMREVVQSENEIFPLLHFKPN